MEAVSVSTDRAPAAIGPYSQAVVFGDLVFTSGQIALDPNTGQMVGDDIVQQTQQVMQNLAAVLEAAGASLDTVIRTTVYLASLSDFAAMNEVYSRFFGNNRPARSTVQAAALPRGALVEIDAIAYRR